MSGVFLRYAAIGAGLFAGFALVALALSILKKV